MCFPCSWTLILWTFKCWFVKLPPGFLLHSVFILSLLLRLFPLCFPDISCFLLPPNNGVYARLSSGTPWIAHSSLGVVITSVWFPTFCFLVFFQSCSSASDLCLWICLPSVCLDQHTTPAATCWGLPDIFLSGHGDTILPYLYVRFGALIPPSVFPAPHPVDGHIPLIILWTFFPTTPVCLPLLTTRRPPQPHTWTAGLLSNYRLQSFLQSTLYCSSTLYSLKCCLVYITFISPFERFTYWFI